MRPGTFRAGRKRQTLERIVALRHRFRFWSASLSLAVGLAGIGLAGAFDDRRHSGARRVGREGSAATSTDRSGRAGGVGSFGEQRVVRGFQRLVPHARRAADRSVDGDRPREPLSAGGTDSQAQPRGKSGLFSSAFSGTSGLPDAVRSDNGLLVRIVGRGWAFATVDMVAEAGRRAAFRPSGFAAGQWSTRADAPHAGGADDATAGAVRERTAAALRRVSPALQRGASARGAGAEAAGANLAPLLAADARADRRPLVRRPSRGPTRPPLRRNPMARRKHIHRRGPGRRSRRPRRTRPGPSHRAFQPSRPRHDRSEKNLPPFRPAASPRQLGCTTKEE